MRLPRTLVVIVLAVAAVLGLAYGWKQSPASGWLADGHERRELDGGEIGSRGDAPPPPDGDERGERGRDHHGHGGSLLDVADSLVPIALVTAAVAGYDRVTRRRRRARRIRLTA